MRTEKEIKELLDRLDAKKGVLKELDNMSFLSLSDKAGHWIDCLEWVLGEVKK